MLSPYRVLDLTDEKGFLCGRILADLGADVIKVEKPDGDPSRNIAPFYHDIAHPEKSLYWFAYNAGKRGITLNIETAEGREIFKELVKRSDFVIESFDVDYLNNLGLGYQELSKLNPRLILTSITPFGQDGPYRNYPASDLVMMAAGGYLYVTGDSDRAPVRISFPQAYLHGSGQAAAVTLIAHYYRELTGEGQYVDISIQASLVWTTFSSIPAWELNRVLVKRAGQFRIGLMGTIKSRQIFRCQDGFVIYFLAGGTVHARSNQNLVRWIDSEGMANDSLKSIDWYSVDMSKITQEFIDQVEGGFGRFFLKHTKAELYEGGLKRGIDVYPVNTVEDVAQSPQLQARGFWVDIEHNELADKVRYPGIPAKVSSNLYRLRSRAPLIGEHNEEIYVQELGFTKEQLLMLKQGNII